MYTEKGLYARVRTNLFTIERWSICGRSVVKFEEFEDRYELEFQFILKTTDHQEDYLFELKQDGGDFHFSFYYSENLNSQQCSLNAQERTLGMLLRRSIEAAVAYQGMTQAEPWFTQLHRFNLQKQACKDMLQVCRLQNPMAMY